MVRVLYNQMDGGAAYMHPMHDRSIRLAAHSSQSSFIIAQSIPNYTMSSHSHYHSHRYLVFNYTQNLGTQTLICHKEKHAHARTWKRKGRSRQCP